MALLPKVPFTSIEDFRVAVDAPVSTDLMTDIAIDLGVDTGIGGREAVKLFIPMAIVSTTVGMISGWLADRVPVRALVLASVSFQTISYIGAGRLGETFFMLMMVVGWGMRSLFSTVPDIA